MSNLWQIYFHKTLTRTETVVTSTFYQRQMAAYSDVNIEGSTMDAYYTRTLRFTTSTDAGSRETMDIVKNSMIYDIAILYDWGNWVYLLENIDTMSYNPYYDGTEPSYLEETRSQIASTIIQFGFAD